MTANKMWRKIPHGVIVRAPGLLPMLYKPSELEQELGIPAFTVRGWLGKGLPHQRDNRGHIWINGRQFAEWVRVTCRSRPRHSLREGEAYCLRCRKPVKMIKPTMSQQGKRSVLCGTCPACGGSISRGGRSG
jgi:hypothetical protein